MTRLLQSNMKPVLPVSRLGICFLQRFCPESSFSGASTLWFGELGLPTRKQMSAGMKLHPIVAPFNTERISLIIRALPFAVRSHF
jgi:hypothetical protein